MGCRKCALNTIESLSAFDLFDDLTRFYSLDDTSLAQIDSLRMELSRRLGETIADCQLPESSPIAKVKRDLDRATNVEEMLWAIQNFEGALYQSLKTEVQVERSMR